MKSLRFWSGSYLAVSFILGYFVFFQGYAKPAALFWDENYHIASALKYLHGVFFLEPHPPLGKLFIALGERLLGPNQGLDLTVALDTDYVKKLPAEFSYRGVRFFPALFGWLTAPLFFFALSRLCRSVHLAFLFSLFYLLENGFVLQSRGAMLDSAQFFFIVATLALVFDALRREKSLPLGSVMLIGAMTGCAIAVKVSSAILFLSFSAILWRDIAEKKWARLFVKAGALFLTPCFVLLCSYAVHFRLAHEMYAARDYRVSPSAKALFAAGRVGELQSLPVFLREAFEYTRRYERNVPRLDVCKQGENGSHPLLWVLGGKTINYRWERTSPESVRYLYFVLNPAVVFAVLGAFLAATILIGAHFLYGLEIIDRKRFWIIVMLWLLYAGYMAVMLNVTRVMYLYHYLVPLIFGIFLSAVMFEYLFEQEVKKRSPVLMTALALLGIELIACFLFFSPLTYYQPMTAADIAQRAWFSFWQLRPV